jgi:hypothetical protein
MTVRLYRHDDTSAPVLTGQNGSLTTLLDAVLVNGYGSKTAAGWSINQTTTNKRAYKQGTGGAHPTGAICWIDDAAPGAAGAREARVTGFDAMTAITPVGTGQFPNNTQSAIGVGCLVIRKSATTDATPRKWYIVADAWTFYLFIEQGDDTAPNITGTGFMFGDFKSYKSGDAYAQMIIGRQTENTNDHRYENMSCIPGRAAYSINDNMPGHFMSRHWNQLNPSVRGGKMTSDVLNRGNTIWAGNNQTGNTNGQAAPGYFQANYVAFPYPNPVDGSLWMCPFYVNQNGMRGYMKGFWCPQQHMPLNPGDTFTVATGNLAGKSFIAVNGAFWANAGERYPTQYFIEYSDTWPA